jgi:DHA2 family multidrug resistance protein-like MFS transporter
MTSLAIGLVMLSTISADTSTLQFIATIFFFGLAGGLGLVPLTDLVMSSVPPAEAGVASAVNDVSRELGAALGVAAIGSVVSGAYRSNIEHGLAGNMPAEVIHQAGDGLGVATVLAHSLPAEAAGHLLSVANAGFVDAIGTGFLLSAALLAVPMLAAALFLPGRVHSETLETQLQPEDELADEEAALAA